MLTVLSDTVATRTLLVAISTNQMDPTEPQPGLKSETPASSAAYLKFIDNARKVVALAMLVCGLGFVLCVQRDDYLRETLRGDSGMWGWGWQLFGIGICACVVAAAGLVMEYFVRSWKGRPLRRCEVLFAGLLGVGACVVIVVGFVAWMEYSEHTHRKRLEALGALHKMGGTAHRAVEWKDEVEGDFLEIDMRNTRLTDADVDYIITLDPKKRLMLGSTQLTESGLKRLQQALPNCKIDLKPPTKDERQSRAAPKQPGG